MNEALAQGIIGKSAELNESPSVHLERAAAITNELTSYLSGDISLTVEEIRKAIVELTLYTYLVPVSIPLASGTVLSRAVKYEEVAGDAYNKVARLSYIPSGLSVTSKKGRMNQNGESIFYSCLNSDANSIGSILSECRANEGDIFNILQCKTKLEVPKSHSDTSLHVVPIGINDHFRRGVPTPFGLHDSFREMYDLLRKNTHPTAMLAMQICDAFLTDVLTRKGSKRLYDVTSEIGRECLKPDILDGVLYPSTRFEGFPNLALKPGSVDRKIRFETAISIRVEKCFGYGMYRIKILRQGVISGQDILWS
jgi:hypothetical protein